jgi:integrase
MPSTANSSTTNLSQQPISMIKLRERQVSEMIAGKLNDQISSETWPEASNEMIQRWKNRHPSYQTFTSHYMNAQRRILFLADVKPFDRFEAFEAICFNRRLAPTTAETYWTTWLGIQKALMIQPCDADHRITKLLKARSTAYPVQFPKPALLQDMNMIRITFESTMPSLTAIAFMTFLLGQRISDMIQLAVADLQVTSQHLMITVRRGKTMSVSQPYTLWLRRNQYPTETIIQLMNSAKTNSRLFLLTEFNSDEERQKLLQLLREMIASVNDRLELRSFRRGGLQRMAQLGFSVESILKFSRHSDASMLYRYLSWGQEAAHSRKEMLEIVDLMTMTVEKQRVQMMNQPRS